METGQNWEKGEIWQLRPSLGIIHGNVKTSFVVVVFFYVLKYFCQRIAEIQMSKKEDFLLNTIERTGAG